MRTHVLGIAAVIAIAVTACSGDSGSEPALVEASSTTTTTTTTTAPSAAVTTTTTATTTTAAGTGTTTTTLPDPALLVGTWFDPSVDAATRGIYLTFADDGTHYVSYLDGEPFEFGPYTLEGTRLTMVAEGGSEPACLGLGPGVYDITIGADGSWMFGRVVSESCNERAMSLQTSLSRVESTD